MTFNKVKLDLICMKQVILTISLLLSVNFCEAGTVRVYAAASLTDALNDIAQLYQSQNPQTKVIQIVGASSTLARQVELGAPADLYFSADQAWMEYLVSKNKISKSQVKPFLFNEIVVVSGLKNHNVFKPSAQFNFAKSFKGYLCTGEMQSVPIGKYAKQSLTYFNWLKPLQGRIVLTDDVRSALAFVERGECEVGIVYKTDALASKIVKIIGTFPHHSHQAVIYPIALTQQGSQSAEALKLYRFISNSNQAKQIFKKYGFKY